MITKTDWYEKELNHSRKRIKIEKMLSRDLTGKEYREGRDI